MQMCKDEVWVERWLL